MTAPPITVRTTGKGCKNLSKGAQTRLEILDFLRANKAAGRIPTYEEIGAHVGRCQSVVHRHLQQLEREGHVRRFGKFRALEVVEAGPSRLEILEALLRSYRHAAEGMSFFSTQNERTDAFLGVE